MSIDTDRQEALAMRSIQDCRIIHRVNTDNTVMTPDSGEMVLGELYLDTVHRKIFMGVSDLTAQNNDEVFVNDIIELAPEKIGKALDSGFTDYVYGDIVTVNEKAYICLNSSPKHYDSFEVEAYKDWAPLDSSGSQYTGVNSYFVGDIVTNNGKIYIAIINNHEGVNYALGELSVDFPGSGTANAVANWEEIFPNGNFVPTKPAGIAGATAVGNMVSISQVDYDALTVPRDPATIFIIK